MKWLHLKFVHSLGFSPVFLLMPLISIVSQCFPLRKHLHKPNKFCYLFITEWWKVVRDNFDVTKMIRKSYISLVPRCLYLTFDQQWSSRKLFWRKILAEEELFRKIWKKTAMSHKVQVETWWSMILLCLDFWYFNFQLFNI